MKQQQEFLSTQFLSDTTLRWSCRKGDLIVWYRWTNVFAEPENGLNILDFWQMRSGDFVMLTNRIDDLPPWFELHPTEVCNQLAYQMMEKLENGYEPGEVMEGPNLWRVRAGDRLAWIRAPKDYFDGGWSLLALLDFSESALAVGEAPNFQSLEDSIAFGTCNLQSIGKEGTSKVHESFEMVLKMGLPASLASDWKLG